MAVRGVANTQAKLKAYELKAKRETKKAIARVTTKALAAAKSALPRDRTGQLRRSMGKKVGTDKKGNPYGLVGPRRRFGITLTTTGRKTSAAFLNKAKTVGIRGVRVRKPRKVIPTKYATLVAKGTKRSRGKDFLAPARAIVRGSLQSEVATAIRSIRGA